MTEDSLRDQTALVTGASSGIGAAIARAFAAHGMRVALTARRANLLEQVASDCRAAGSPEVVVLTADLTDVEAAERVALAAWDELGGLDVVVNNAGIPKRRNVAKLTFADVVEVQTVNYLSPVRIMLALIPRMVGRGSGMFVNIGSGAARAASPQEAAYTGSKFALAGFTEAAFVDLAGTGVTFRLVEPGPIETPIWDEMAGNDSPIYKGRFYPPEDVADAVVAAVLGDTFEYFVPPEQQRIIEFKSHDIDAFLKGAIAFAQGAVVPRDVDRPPS
ncbi:MAG: SDR family NAD(P)-dependent oxidoreductase [Actinomycetes bacterium]